jgi:hypothetical protein
VRIASKSVEVSTTTLQSATAQSPRQSFVDTLASVSSYPVQGTRCASSYAQGRFEERSNDSTNGEDRNHNRSSIQSTENASAASTVIQSKTASTTAQQADSKPGQSDDSATLARKAGTISDRNSQKVSPKRVAFTAQVASQINYQASTAQPQLSEMFCASTIATETQASKLDSQVETSDAHPVIPVSTQGSDQQPQASKPGSAGVISSLNSRVDQGSDEELASTTSQTAHSAAGQVSQRLTSVGLALPLSGMFRASTTTSDTSASRLDSQVETSDAHPVIPVSTQSSDQQPQEWKPGSVSGTAALNSRIDKGSNAELASKASQSALSAAGQVAQSLPSADRVAPLQDSGIGAQRSDASTDANGGPSSNPVSMAQASLSAVAPGDGGTNQPAGRVIPAKVLSSAFGLNSDAGDLTGKNQPAKGGDAGDLSSSLHSAVTASQQTQHVQADGAQTAVFDAKGAGANISQVAANAAAAETSGATGPHASGGSTGTETHHGDGSESPAAQPLVDRGTAGMSGISTARLIQTMGETQMRVGMHSSEFGDISIRTVVSQQQMQAQISVDHSELGNALSAHIPSLQTKLGSEYGLHATIEVNQSGASFSNGGERSSQNQQQTVARSLQGAEAPAAIQNDILSPRISAETSGEYRLDIRA